jgi:hypothetical protein
LYPIGGSVFLYGPPGIGKSFIAQGLNHTITWGKAAGSFQVEHTANVLYCDFEGNANLVRERSLALTPMGNIPSDVGGTQMPTDTTYLFAQDWKGRSFPERLAELEQRLYDQESRDIGFSLVIIDTFTAFVGSKPCEANAYEYDRECIEALNQLAERLQVCILLIHHPNKSGEISGSMGRAGTAWIAMSFKRVADGQAVLSMEKNRVDRELTLTFDWDAQRIWRLSTDMPAKVALAKGNHRALLRVLSEHGPLGKADLMQITGMPEGSVKSGLNRLQLRGDVELLDGNLWRTTFPATCELPVMPVWDAWKHCPACNFMIDPAYGCVNMRCERHIAQNWPAVESALRREPPAEPEQEPEPPTPDPRPKWKQMATRRGPAEVELVEVDASSRLVEGEKRWNTSPVSTAIDLIMADRDAGKLAPTWRIELPAEITDSTLDGQHRWGTIPQRRQGVYLKQPAGDWSSYDARGSFLASYKTALCVKPLPPLRESDGREWTRQHGGALEILMPQWGDVRIGHPAGTKARPGTWQVVWSPTYRLLRRLADAGLIEPVQVRRTALRCGYQEASEALLTGFYDRMKLARETYTGEELVYVKEMYSGWLSSAKDGKNNVFKRMDWWYSIRSEAFGRLWDNGWNAVLSGIELLGMGNTDEIIMRSDLRIPALFPEDDRRIGKMTLKEAGRG